MGVVAECDGVGAWVRPGFGAARGGGESGAN